MTADEVLGVLRGRLLTLKCTGIAAIREVEVQLLQACGAEQFADLGLPSHLSSVWDRVFRTDWTESPNQLATSQKISG